jgi:hypothetical protein
VPATDVCIFNKYIPGSLREMYRQNSLEMLQLSGGLHDISVAIDVMPEQAVFVRDIYHSLHYFEELGA